MVITIWLLLMQSFLKLDFEGKFYDCSERILRWEDGQGVLVGFSWENLKTSFLCVFSSDWNQFDGVLRQNSSIKVG